jgi:(+)-trans-carveol dehydrogenase
MDRLKGKVAFITGAARGQGRAHAIRLAEEGADIIAVDICAQVDSVPYPMGTREDLDETVAAVEKLDRRIVATVADVRDLAAVKEAVDLGVAELGRLDIAVINHGIASFGTTHEMSEERWDDMIETNLTGVWKSARAVVPHLIEGGRGGSIVIISSGAAVLGIPNIGHYSAAKNGAIALTRTMAAELGGHNIRVNAILPGTVATPMVENEATYRLFRPDLDSPTAQDAAVVFDTMSVLPMGLIDPSDLSNAVLFLVSDDARVITGALLPVGTI